MKTNKANRTKAKPLPRLRLPMAAALAALLVVCGAVWCSCDGDVLFRIQELNLFLYTPLFLKQQLVVPGGLLGWLGAWFTQYLYHPGLGITLLMLWWSLLMVVTARCFRLPSQWWLLLIMPITLLLITDVDLGYWIYYLKLRGHFFLTTIGLVGAVSLVWLYRSLPGRGPLRASFIVVAAFAAYPAMGAYGLLAVLLMGCMAWRLPGGTRAGKVVESTVAVAAICLVPLFYYYAVYYQTNIDRIYFAALPDFSRDEAYTAYYIPYALTALFLIVMALAYGRWRRLLAIARWKWVAAQAVLLVVAVASAHRFWYKDPAFHAEARMNRCVENMDWDGVLQAYRDFGADNEPTRMMWLYKDLALLHKGTLLQDMYRYKNGMGTPNAPFTVSMTQTGATTIYFNLGQMNFCIRWCVENGMEYGWSVDTYRYMLLCALANGEYDVARKYIRILKRTKYYSGLADKCQAYVGRPQLMRRDAMFCVPLRLMPRHDYLTGDRSRVELYLVDRFSYTDSDDPLYETMSMAMALQRKDIATFWDRFAHYAPMVGGHMPALVQQAAYLFGHLEDKVDISQMPFDRDVVETYNAFMSKGQSSGLSDMAQLKQLLYPEFGGTYYYDYYFIRDQETY